MSQTRDWYSSLAARRPSVQAAVASASTLPKYDYDIEDCYPDLNKGPDVWSEYLRARIRHRRQLYEDLDASEQDLIHKEIRRILYFRGHFKDYRVFPDDSLPLVALLEDSRTKWRGIAARRAADELAKCQRLIDKEHDNRYYGIRLRNRTILRHVQLWNTGEYAATWAAMDPAAYMNLDSGPDNSEDDPQKADYGYNGWIAVWEEDEGWVSMDHPLVHGSFPHQKISIQQFLYNKEGTPLRRSNRKDQLRYFHLPANNMKWVEVRHTNIVRVPPIIRVPPQPARVFLMR